MDTTERGEHLPVPRLTMVYLEGLIVTEDYHHFDDTGITVCCLTVENGYSVIAEAACANPELFELAVGKKRARRKAMSKLMELEHYLFRQRLFEHKRDLDGVSEK